MWCLQNCGWLFYRHLELFSQIRLVHGGVGKKGAQTEKRDFISIHFNTNTYIYFSRVRSHTHTHTPVVLAFVASPCKVYNVLLIRYLDSRWKKRGSGTCDPHGVVKSINVRVRHQLLDQQGSRRPHPSVRPTSKCVWISLAVGIQRWGMLSGDMSAFVCREGAV